MKIIKTYLIIFSSLMILYNCNPMKDFKILYGEEALDESLKIEVYYKEAMSFGPQLIKVFAIEPDGNKYLLLSDKVYNDGSNLSKKNVGVKWLINSRAEIFIRGKEMDTKKYLISKKDDLFKAELESD